MTCKNRPRNDLLCVEWDVKPLHYYYYYYYFVPQVCSQEDVRVLV